MPQFDSEYEAKLYGDRLASLEKIAELGEKAGLSRAEATYPNSFRFTHTIPELRALGEPKSGEELEAAPVAAAIAGRVMAHRSQGKAGFAQLQGGGERIQIYVRKDDVGEDAFALYKLLHLGDHVGVRGTLMRTRTGELTLHVKAVELPGDAARGAEKPGVQPGGGPITFLAKATLALPDKYHGLEDVELRYRQRYVDLIMNSGTRAQQAAAAAGPDAAPAAPGVSAVTEGAAPAAEHEDAPRDVRAVFVKRAAVLRAIRKFFDARGYVEVETPMLHSVVGGAAARPFTTHHNALDMPLYLRIAPELFLKRLVVGGLDRVYEINRNFRNEGVSTRHNPEFTMLEFYQAYANYWDLMDLTEELVKFVATEVNGTTLARFGGAEIDLGKWTRLSMREAIVKWWPEWVRARPTSASFSTPEALVAFAAEALHELLHPEPSIFHEYHAAYPHTWLSLLKQTLLLITASSGNGKHIAQLFELLGEDPTASHLIQPTIIYDFPLAVSPLSKVKPDEPEWVERFEFYIGGFEVGNAFSELNDAADQEQRFAAQVAEKERGDEEAMGEVDEDYVRALGFGLPPTGGEGIGIDRLTMVLTGSRSIRDVILFPLMRPVRGEAAPDSGEAAHGESAE